MACRADWQRPRSGGGGGVGVGEDAFWGQADCAIDTF